MKHIVFLGDALGALRRFPESARRRAGFQLDRADAVYVLHAFEKMSQRTSRLDLDLATSPLRHVDEE